VKRVACLVGSEALQQFLFLLRVVLFRDEVLLPEVFEVAQALLQAGWRGRRLGRQWDQRLGIDDRGRGHQGQNHPVGPAQLSSRGLQDHSAGGGAGTGGAGSGQRGGQSGGGPWAGQGGGGGDMQQMLSRAPAIQLADLKKGDAVMLVSTDGATDVTAITLLAGVEPLLEAPAASQNMLNNWSMNTGAGAAEAAAQ